MSSWHLVATGANLSSRCRVIPPHYRKCPSPPVTGCEQLWQSVFKATSSHNGLSFIYTVTTAMTMITHAFRTLTLLQLFIPLSLSWNPWLPRGAVKDFVLREIVPVYSNFLTYWNVPPHQYIEGRSYTLWNYELYISCLKIIQKYSLYVMLISVQLV